MAINFALFLHLYEKIINICLSQKAPKKAILLIKTRFLLLGKRLPFYFRSVSFILYRKVMGWLVVFMLKK